MRWAMTCGSCWRLGAFKPDSLIAGKILAKARQRLEEEMQP
jgi:hypothetical protein